MPRKIFLIDDEPINNKINKMVFTKVQPENEYIDFLQPEVAYEALAAQQPELIFLDLNMPVMSGWDFLDKMAKDGNTTGVIILSSSISAADREKSTTYPNVIEYMNKPPDKVLLAIHL